MGETPGFVAFRDVLDELRGMDLDNDAALLAEGSDDALFMGVLHCRASSWDEALAALDAVPGAAADFVAAYAVARLGRLEEALGRIDGVEPDDAVDEAAPDCGRGSILWAMGRLPEALEAFTSGLKIEARGPRLLEMARLQVEMGHADAVATVRRAVGVDDTLHDGHYLLAALLAQAGDLDGALEALRQAIFWRREYAAAARADERMAMLRGHPAFVEMTAPPAVPDLTWLDAWPSLREAGGGTVKWCGRDEAVKAGAQLLARYAGNYSLGLLWTPALWEACRQRAQGMLQVASCGTLSTRTGDDEEGALYVDPAGQLWFTPSDALPTVLWIPLTPRDIAETLAWWYGPAQDGPSGPHRERTELRRAAMGSMDDLVVPNPYSGKMVGAAPHDLDRHWTMCPMLDAFMWGSGWAEDPWPDRIPPQPDFMVKITAAMREFREQQAGSVSRFTQRTRLSRSHLTVEIHRQGFYVWEISYAANPWPAVVAAFNRIAGCDLPTDLPLDVVAVLHGFPFVQASELERWLDEDEGDTAATLSALAAVRHDDLAVTSVLSRYLTHPSVAVRAAVANAAVQYNWEFLLQDLGRVEKERRVFRFIDRLLTDGIPPPRYNQMGEPEGIAEESEG